MPEDILPEARQAIGGSFYGMYVKVVVGTKNENERPKIEMVVRGS